MTRLAASVGLCSRGPTTLVDRLVLAGLVDLVHSVDDQRVSYDAPW